MRLGSDGATSSYIPLSLQRQSYQVATRYKPLASIFIYVT